MEMANKFYKSFPNEKGKHEYDILQLDDRLLRGCSTAFLYSDRLPNGGEPYYSETTQQDYDEKFVEMLLEIYPVYRASDLLTYHYDNYINEQEGKMHFIKHIEYVILQKVAGYVKGGLYQIIRDWVNQNKKIMLRKQLEEKNQFLHKAYEVANEVAPESPFSVDINPIDLGKELGFNETTTIRIMNELVADGYVRSSLGMGDLFVTMPGLKYLRALDTDSDVAPQINFSVGNNSNVQFQQGNTGSSQSMKISSNNKEELKRLALEIKANLEEIKKYLSPDQLTNLVAETDYLENNLNRATPNNSTLQLIKINILDILKSVPANIIANIITGQIPI